MRYEYSDARPDPIPELKRRLGAQLAELLQGWNADDIATRIGTDRPRVSELRRGKLERFSLETLIRYLDRLRHRVDITVTRVPHTYRREVRSPRGLHCEPNTAPREPTETSTDDE